MATVILSAWASREPLAKYFVRHYEWADKIIALVGPGSWQGPDFGGKVEIREVNSYPMGRFCEYTKRDALNQTLRGLDSDWVIVVDVDELLFTTDPQCRPMEDLRPFLETVDDQENVVMAAMWNVYPHVDDADLDPTRPPLLQRRHGDLVVDPMYVKPVAIRKNLGNGALPEFRFVSGQHRLFSNPLIRVSRKLLGGAHWKNADLRIAIERKRIRDATIHPLQRRDEPDPRVLCYKHKNDPLLL